MECTQLIHSRMHSRCGQLLSRCLLRCGLVQNDSAATQISQLSLQRVGMLGAYRDCHLHASGSEVFTFQQAVDFRETQLDQRQFTEAAFKVE